jgi:hypothetical protein
MKPTIDTQHTQIEFTPEVQLRHQQHRQRLQRLSQLDDIAWHYPAVDQAIRVFLADIVAQIKAHNLK